MVLYRCRRSRETHDKRHREIAVLVEAILQIDETNGPCTPLSATKRKARKYDNVFDIARDADDDASVYEGDVLDNISGQNQENTPPSLCTPTSKEAKRGQKLKKAERKMAKSQSRVKVISTEDIRRTADAIHPTTAGGKLDTQSHSRQNNDGPLNSKLVADNVAYVSATSEYYKSRIRKDYGANKKAVRCKTAPPQTAPAAPTTRPGPDETASILSRLNIKVIVLAAASKERKSLVAKLQDAIHADLTVTDNEDRDTMMRQAGYFRYVNRRTYNAMVRNNQIWDWVSGRKLEEVDEEEEDDGAVVDDDVDDDDDDRGGMGRERVIEDYGEDFVFDGEERQLQLQVAHRLVAVEDLDTDHSAAPPLEMNVSSVTPSPATEEESSAPCDVAEPVTPRVACEEFVLKLSMASVREGAAEYVPSFDRDGDGDGGTERKQEQEQEQELPKQVDTTYAITNLEPEVLWC